MQTLHLEGFRNILRSNKENKTATVNALEHLRNSSVGLHDKTKPTGAYDSFSITENISELLSPACGMTDEEKETYLNKILAKLKSGKKLTAEEMRFLQAENPVLYQQAARVQAMRESLETRLTHATSKENAVSIYSDAISHIGENDPMKEYIVAAYDDAMKEFQKTDTYQTLPQTEKDAEEINAPDTFRNN